MIFGTFGHLVAQEPAVNEDDADEVTVNQKKVQVLSAVFLSTSKSCVQCYSQRIALCEVYFPL